MVWGLEQDPVREQVGRLDLPEDVFQERKRKIIIVKKREKV